MKEENKREEEGKKYPTKGQSVRQSESPFSFGPNVWEGKVNQSFDQWPDLWSTHQLTNSLLEAAHFVSLRAIVFSLLYEMRVAK